MAPLKALRRFIWLPCLVAVTLVLAAAPLLAEKRGARIDLMLRDLPPAGSAPYQSLRAAAGDATSQFLPITKTEVWRVRPSNVRALMRAAKRHHVGIEKIDHTWSQMLMPMASHHKMDSGQKSMMDLAMAAPSTAAVSMMSMAPAGMMEYALTNGMSDKSADKGPMGIRIALNDHMTITAQRTNVVVSGHRVVWHGVVEGTEDPVTIMWWNTGRVTGSVQHKNRLYQLKHMGGGMIGIVETMPEMLPDEHATMTPAQAKQMIERRAPSPPATVAPPVAPHAVPPSRPARPDRSEIETLKDAAIADSRPKRTARDERAVAAKMAPTNRVAQQAAAPRIVIDVMIAYTAKAAAHYSDIGTDLIELAIEETNRSFHMSGIDNVAVRLVHTHKTDYDESKGQHFDHLWRMVDKGDGYMEEIGRLRDEKKADVVVLILDDAKGCGLATRVGAEADEAYAVVHHECAATSYSVAHEIGHLIGARHNRPIDNSPGPYPYGHGFVSPGMDWRSMMSYRASCNGCPRMPVWSTPLTQVKGQAAGDEMQDNARVIREQAARVAAFR
jgi:hypothetical protein